MYVSPCGRVDEVCSGVSADEWVGVLCMTVCALCEGLYECLCVHRMCLSVFWSCECLYEHVGVGMGVHEGVYPCVCPWGVYACVCLRARMSLCPRGCVDLCVMVRVGEHVCGCEYDMRECACVHCACRRV